MRMKSPVRAVLEQRRLGEPDLQLAAHAAVPAATRGVSQRKPLEHACTLGLFIWSWSVPNALMASCGAHSSWGLRCLVLRGHVPASPHVWLQDEKTSGKGKMKLFCWLTLLH